MTFALPEPEPTPVRCFALEPGYQQFPGRCVLFVGHTGDHESSGRRGTPHEPVRWPVDNPFTSEE